jgi:type IV secretion system protein VirB9
LKQYYTFGFALICAATIGLGQGALAQADPTDALASDLDTILTQAEQTAAQTSVTQETTGNVATTPDEAAKPDTPVTPDPEPTPAKPTRPPVKSVKLAETEDVKPVQVEQVFPASIPHVRSIAEGQAQNVRSAAGVIALREGIVSPGAGVRLVMVFGQSYPVLVCKVGLTCLIELEDGEEMLDTPLLSDPVRWELSLRIRDEPIVKGTIALKAHADAGEATLALFTNRRTYYIVLVPDLVAHTPILAFSYPDSDMARVAQVIADRKAAKANAQAATKAKKARVVAKAKAKRSARVAQSGVQTVSGAVPADELDFNYRITGRATFKPVRVYTDGKRTYVELPSNYRGEVPAIIAGGSNANSTVNIAVKKGGRQLIADKMLTSFTLLAGNKKIHVKKGL